MENTQSKTPVVAVGYACVVMNILILPIVFTVLGIFMALISLFSGKIAHGLIILFLCIVTGFMGASRGGWGLGLGKPNFNSSSFSSDKFVGSWVCSSHTVTKLADSINYVGEVYKLAKEDFEDNSGQYEYEFFGKGMGDKYILKDENTLMTDDDDTEIHYDDKNDQLILTEKKFGITMVLKK